MPDIVKFGRSVRDSNGEFIRFPGQRRARWFSPQAGLRTAASVRAATAITLPEQVTRETRQPQDCRLVTLFSRWRTSRTA